MVSTLDTTDQRSFSLGMIFAFAEIVAAGAKPLALSPPIKPEMFVDIKKGSDEIVEQWQLQCFVEHEILQTELFPEDALQNIIVILYYRDPAVLAEYLQLKEMRRALVAEGTYKGEARRTIARRFGQLLGYSQTALDERLCGQDGPFANPRSSITA